MLVGHLPFMERLASYLLMRQEDVSILHFKTSAVACLSMDSGQWTLEWFLPPGM